jgi:hypothetical protein
MPFFAYGVLDMNEAVEGFNLRKLEALREFQKAADEIQEGELDRIWADLKAQVEGTHKHKERFSGTVLRFPTLTRGRL